MKKANEIFEILEDEPNKHMMIQDALQRLVSKGGIRGFVLVTFNGQATASWHAKTGDIVQAINAMTGEVTGSEKFADRMCEEVSRFIDPPDQN